MAEKNSKSSVIDLFRMCRSSRRDKSKPLHPSNRSTTVQKQTAVIQPTHGTIESNPSSRNMSQPIQEHAKKLRSKYTQISNGLIRTGDILAELYQSEVLTAKERDDIQLLLSTTVRANEQLLNTLMSKDSRAYDCFLRALSNTDQNHISDIIKREDKYLDAEHSLIIQRNYTTLVDNLDVDCGLLLDRLHEAGLITVREMAAITAKQTKHEKSETLLALVSRFRPENFSKFVRTLEKSSQDHVACILANSECPKTKSIISTSTAVESRFKSKHSEKQEQLPRNLELQDDSTQNLHHAKKRMKEPPFHVKRKSFMTLGSRFADLPDELQTELSLKVTVFGQKTVLHSEASVDICFRKLLQGFIQHKKEFSRKQSEVEDMREILRRVNDSAENFTHQFEDKHETEIQILGELQKQSDELQREKGELQKQKNELKTQRDKFKKEQDELQKQRNELNKEKDIFKKQSDKIQKEKDELQTQRDELQKENGELQKQKNKLKNQRDKFQKEQDDLQKQRNELNTEKDILKKQSDEIQKVKDELQKQRDELQKEKDELLKQRNELQTEKLQKQRDKLQKPRNELQKQSNELQLQKQIDELQKENDKLRKQSSEAKKLMEKNSKTFDQLMEKDGAMAELKQKLEQESKAWAEENEHLKIEMQEIRKNVSAMRNQFDIVSPSIGQNSSCQWDDYTCISDSSCINRNLTCNGKNDCFDGSDEINCPFTDWGKPRLFIETDDEGELLVNEETKMCLEKILEPVVVVSVVGLYRTGKSFLLNRLSCMGQGFELGSTVESKTKGIWIWVVPHPKRDDCRLVLIDTEGFGDMDKVKMVHHIWIFVLAILLSGTFVYNSKGAIDQKAMHDLHLVTEIAERIKVKSMSDDDIGVGEKGSNPGASSSRSEADELKKFFPTFVWALRDFKLELEINGNVCTPDEYLEHALTANIPEAPEKGQDLKVSDNQMATPDHPKDCIKDYFPKRRCFVFPIPVERTSQIKEINKLRDCELDKMFIKVVHEFCDYIFSESEVKTVFGDITTGRALARLATIYVESIRNGNAPCIQNAVESTAKIENEQAIKESVDLYTKKFKALSIFPIFKTMKEMCDCHSTCSNEAFDFFLTKSVFDSRRIYYQQLAAQINEVYAGCSKDYEVKAAEACKTQLDELYNKIDVNDYLTTGGYSKYEAAMQELVDTYENTPHLEEVTAHLLSEFKKSKEVTRKLILRVDVKLTEAERQIKDLKTKEEAKKVAKIARKEAEKRIILLEEERERSIKEHIARLAEKAGKAEAPWNWFS